MDPAPAPPPNSGAVPATQIPHQAAAFGQTLGQKGVFSEDNGNPASEENFPRQRPRTLGKLSIHYFHCPCTLMRKSLSGHFLIPLQFFPLRGTTVFPGRNGVLRGVVKVKHKAERLPGHSPADAPQPSELVFHPITQDSGQQAADPKLSGDPSPTWASKPFTPSTSAVCLPWI